MEPEFWIQRWKKKQIGFHQEQYHFYLELYGDKFFQNAHSVCLPLCGKTKDLLWFYQKGFHVVGIEISPIACEEFFQENQIPYQIQKENPFNVYISTDKKVMIFNGNFFQLKQKHLQSLNLQIDAIYDRASLIALPQDLRKQYVQLIYTLFFPFQYFLIVLEFLMRPEFLEKENKQNNEVGPPFSVSREEIYSLYGKHFRIQTIERKSCERENTIYCSEILYTLERKK